MKRKKAMADKIVVEAAARESRGKNEARRQRVAGNIPATLYGGKDAAISLTVNAKKVGQILRSPSGHNTLFQVALDGKEQPAIVKDWQVDPVSGNLLHVDLLRIPMDKNKMKLVTELERVLAHVVALRVEEEKPVDVVAAEVAAPAEPEVIKKGKKEAEGEEAVEAEAKPKAEKTEKTEKTEKKK